MVLNSLVVSLIPVAILSLQVAKPSQAIKIKPVYVQYLVIRASWTRTGKVC